MAYELDHSVWTVYFVWYASPLFDPQHSWNHWCHPRSYVDKTGKVSKREMRNAANWMAPGKRDAAASNYPLIGCYDSSDEKVIRWHMRTAREHGIDGFIVGWWGPHPKGDPEGNTDKPLAMAAEMAKDYGLSLAIVSDGEAEPVSMVRRLKLIWDLYGKNESFLDTEGRMMIYTWTWGRMGTAGIDRVKAELEAYGARYFYVGDAPFSTFTLPSETSKEALAERFDALGHFISLPDSQMVEQHELARRMGKMSIGTVSPGIDLSSVELRAGRNPELCPRDDGRFYKNKWDIVAGRDMDAIWVTSWNEWHEGAEVEPSRDEGFLYLQMTKYYSKLYKERRWNDFTNEELEGYLNYRIP